MTTTSVEPSTRRNNNKSTFARAARSPPPPSSIAARACVRVRPCVYVRATARRGRGGRVRNLWRRRAARKCWRRTGHCACAAADAADGNGACTATAIIIAARHLAHLPRAIFAPHRGLAVTCVAPHASPARTPYTRDTRRKKTVAALDTWRKTNKHINDSRKKKKKTQCSTAYVRYTYRGLLRLTAQQQAPVVIYFDIKTGSRTRPCRASENTRREYCHAPVVKNYAFGVWNAP